MKTACCVFLCVIISSSSLTSADQPSASPTVELSGERLRDKIRGGLLGQMLGNLNGLKHEMKYIHEPGNVVQYTPGLPEGAVTDDDTDFEWVYYQANVPRAGPLRKRATAAGLKRPAERKKLWE